jgi:hypothetical protein
MSDQPLFQSSDEQEAVYAPQQLPADHAGKQAADVEVGVPAAGAGLLGQTGGGAQTGVVGGSPGAVGPAVGSEASEDKTAGDQPI